MENAGQSVLYFGLHFVKPKLVLDVLEVLDSDFCILFILLEHSYLPFIQCTGKPRKGQNSTG